MILRRWLALRIPARPQGLSFSGEFFDKRGVDLVRCCERQQEALGQPVDVDSEPAGGEKLRLLAGFHKCRQADHPVCSKSRSVKSALTEPRIYATDLGH